MQRLIKDKFVNEDEFYEIYDIDTNLKLGVAGMCQGVYQGIIIKTNKKIAAKKFETEDINVVI